MGRISPEIARRVSWDSRLLLFELDPARAHHLERQFVRAEWARIRRHFRWNRRDLREIHLHIAVTM